MRMRMIVRLLLMRRATGARLLRARMMMILRGDGRSGVSGMIVVTDSRGIGVRRRTRGAVHITVDATMMMVVRRSVSAAQNIEYVIQ